MAAVRLASPIVVELENMWATMRKAHPDLPENVVFLIGAGGDTPPGYTLYGHYGDRRWRYKPGAGKPTAVPEILITGTCIAGGEWQVITTMVHEAVHALAQARGIKDTSRQNRYHNGKFRTLAEELGMEYKAPRPDSVLGFSDVSLTEETKARLGRQAEKLAAVLKVEGLPNFTDKAEPKTRTVVCVVFEDGHEVEMTTKMYEKLSEHLLAHEAHEEER